MAVNAIAPMPSLLPRQPTSPPAGSLLGVTLIDVLSGRGTEGAVVDAVATTLLCPSGSGPVAPPASHDPCVVAEGAVVKLLRGAGVPPTAISVIKKAVTGQDPSVPVGAFFVAYV